MSAPILPAAAERPWAVARTEMGKTSAASRKVVQLMSVMESEVTGRSAPKIFCSGMLDSLWSELLEEG